MADVRKVALVNVAEFLGENVDCSRSSGGAPAHHVGGGLITTAV